MVSFLYAILLLVGDELAATATTLQGVLSALKVSRVAEEFSTVHHPSMVHRQAFPLRLFQCQLYCHCTSLATPARIEGCMRCDAGCTLPVEMFFPRKEYPTPALEAALADLGVTCRRLPDSRPAATVQEPLLKQPIADSQPGLSGFTMKIAALILSQFREVAAAPHSPFS